MQTVTVVMLGGTELFVERVLPIDLIGFERRYKRPAASLGEDGYFEHMAYIAWHALKRQGDVTADFEKFIAGVAEIRGDDDGGDAEAEVEGEGEAGHPTEPAAP